MQLHASEESLLLIKDFIVSNICITDSVKVICKYNSIYVFYDSK